MRVMTRNINKPINILAHFVYYTIHSERSLILTSLSPKQLKTVIRMSKLQTYKLLTETRNRKTYFDFCLGRKSHFQIIISISILVVRMQSYNNLIFAFDDLFSTARKQIKTSVSRKKAHTSVLDQLFRELLAYC